MNIFSDNPQFDENFYSIIKKLNKKSVATRQKAFNALFDSFSSLPIQSNTTILKDIIVQNMRGELRRESTRLLALILDYDECGDVLCYWFANFLEDTNDKFNLQVLAKVDLRCCGNLLDLIDKEDNFMVFKAYYTLLRCNYTELVENFVLKVDATQQRRNERCISDEFKDRIQQQHLNDQNERSISDEFKDRIQASDCNNPEIYKMIVFILIKLRLTIPEIVISITNPSLIDIKYKIIRNRRLAVDLNQFYEDSRYLSLENIKYVDENYKLEYAKMKIIHKNVFNYIINRANSDDKRDIVLYYINESVEHCNVFEHFNDFDVLNEKCNFEKVNEFLAYVIKNAQEQCKEDRMNLQFANLILQNEKETRDACNDGSSTRAEVCLDAKDSSGQIEPQTVFTYDPDKQHVRVKEAKDSSSCILVLYSHPLICTLYKLNLRQILVRSNLLNIKIKTIRKYDSTVLKTIKDALNEALNVIDKPFFVENQEYFQGRLFYRRYPDLITELENVDEEVVPLLTHEQQKEYGKMIISGRKPVLKNNIPKCLVLPCLYRAYLNNNDIRCTGYDIDTMELLQEYLDHTFVARFDINEKDIVKMLSTLKINNSVFYAADRVPSNSFFYRSYRLRPFSCHTYKKLRVLRKICLHFQFVESLRIINTMLSIRDKEEIAIREEYVNEIGGNKVFCTGDDIGLSQSVCKFIHGKNGDDTIYSYRCLGKGVALENGVRLKDGVRLENGVKLENDVASKDGVVLKNDVRLENDVGSKDDVRQKNDVALKGGVASKNGYKSDEHFYDNLDETVNFYEKGDDTVTYEYLRSLSLSFTKMCYIRVINRIIQSGYFKFTILHGKKKEIYLLNNFIVKPHYIENENLKKLKVTLKFIQSDKLLRVRYFKREKYYELERLIERLSNDIFNTYVRMKSRRFYRNMMKVVNYFDDDVWYYVFIRSVSRIRNISAVLFLEKMILNSGRDISGNTGIEAIDSVAVLADSERKPRNHKNMELSRFLVQQHSPLFNCVREEFAYNFPSLLPLLTNNTIKIDSCIRRELKNKLYNVKLKLLKVTNGYELIATYFINNEDIQCKILIHGDKRPTISTPRKDKFILKLNKLLEVSNRYVEVLSLWKINLDNKMMGRKECLICYYIVDMKGRLPNYECTTCKNIFHVNCIDKYRAQSNNPLCPFCRSIMK